MDDKQFAETLERARKGDQDAMAALVQEYEPEIRRVARRQLGPALRATFDSMDLVQSVHRCLLGGLRRNKGTFAGPQNLVAFAVTMIKRKVARKATRLKFERKIMELRKQLFLQAASGHSDDVAEKIKDLLESLNESDRKLLTLYCEGRSSKEIAALLGVDANKLRVRRSRLLKKLRDAGLDIR